MTTEFKASANLQPGDIVFECPHCGKSLAIDPRGAGLLVTCPDCDHEIEVPDAEEAETSTESPVRADLQDRLDALAAQLEVIERTRHLDRERFDKIAREVQRMQISLERMSSVLREVIPAEELPPNP